MVFREGSRVLATVPLDSTGTASQTTTLSLIAPLPAGTAQRHTITAQYAGMAGFRGSTDWVRIVPEGTATSTSLTSDGKGKGRVGTRELLAPRVSGGTNLSGTVLFLDNGSPIGQAVVRDSVASFLWIPASSGTHSITARYNGDELRSGPSSPALTRSVS